MSKVFMLIRSNPLPGKEAEYNHWYDQVHLPEILAVQGVKAYQRFVLTDEQATDAVQSHKYLIQVEIDGEDVAGTIRRLWEAAPTMRMEPVVDPDALQTMVVKAITDVVRK